MHKAKLYLAVTLLALASQPLLAQHAGHNMGGMGGGNYGHNDDGAMKDMQRLMAVQASPEQKVQFQAWKENTEQLKHQLQELRSASTNADFPARLEALKNGIDKNSEVHRGFINSLTQTQQVGLKKPVENIRKADENLVKVSATTISELGQTNGSSKTPVKLQKIEKALDRLVRQQQQLASEMSIV